MNKPKLIIITGPSGVGKTTLGKEIAQKLNVPFVSKDDIKEQLFDSLGYSDREYSKKIGAASFKILYYCANTMLTKGCSVILETAFNKKYDSTKITKLCETYDCEPITIYCQADPEIVYERFCHRSQSGARHPGHADNQILEEYKKEFVENLDYELEIPGKKIIVNMNNFNHIDINKISAQIKA